MLERLEIRNYVLIKNLVLDFSTGFAVITGETGSGSLLFSERKPDRTLSVRERKKHRSTHCSHTAKAVLSTAILRGKGLKVRTEVFSSSVS